MFSKQKSGKKKTPLKNKNFDNKILEKKKKTFEKKTLKNRSKPLQKKPLKKSSKKIPVEKNHLRRKPLKKL